MGFKHAFKIMIGKFSLVWRILVYILIVTVIIGSIGAAVLIPLVETFKEMGLAKQFNDIIISMLKNESLQVLSDKFLGLYDRVIDEFLAIPKVDWSIKIFFLGIIGILARLLYGFGELAVLSVLDGYMSADAHYNFAGAYLTNLGKSIKYQFSKLLITLPYDIFVLYVLYSMTFLFKFSAIRIFLPPLIMIVFIIMISFKLTALSCWGPKITVDDKGVIKSGLKGFRQVFRRKTFWPIFSTFLVVIILIIALNIFVTFFTLGAGLFLTVPLTALWISCLNMTIYYITTGRRYYIDNDTIITTPRSADNNVE